MSHHANTGEVETVVKRSSKCRIHPPEFIQHELQVGQTGRANGSYRVNFSAQCLWREITSECRGDQATIRELDGRALVRVRDGRNNVAAAGQLFEKKWGIGEHSGEPILNKDHW